MRNAIIKYAEVVLSRIGKRLACHENIDSSLIGEASQDAGPFTDLSFDLE